MDSLLNAIYTDFVLKSKMTCKHTHTLFVATNARQFAIIHKIIFPLNWYASIGVRNGKRENEKKRKKNYKRQYDETSKIPMCLESNHCGYCLTHIVVARNNVNVL